jgi:DNA polymerase-3 subunit alpha
MFCKTDYSLFESNLSINDCIELAKSNGFSKVVLADNNLSGAVAFYKAAKVSGLTPVIALTTFIDEVEYLLISLNHVGFSELTTGESIGFTDSIFVSDNVSTIALNDGLIVKGKYASFHKSGFEYAPLRIANGKVQADYFVNAAMKAVGAKTQFEKQIAFDNVSFNLMQTKEELSLPAFKEIFSKTVNDYQFGNAVPPSFKFGAEAGLPYNLIDPSNDELFEVLCREGLKDRFPNGCSQEYHDRLEFEMNVIKGMSFSGYFLIVWDFIKFAVDNDIPVGPGRGSAAGSLVAYVLRITNLDPMRYFLLFERFLNPDRISFPDVDIDFCQERREEVIEYVRNKYGIECVAQVITFGKLAAKASIKDSARVIGAPIVVGDKMSKMISDKPGTRLSDENSTLAAFVAEDELGARVYEMALKLENLKKNQGVHASALVISNDPIYNRSPLYHVNGTQVVGFEGYYLEDVNLVKYDFLGLKTLTVINNASKELASKGIITDIWTRDYEDKAVYEYISTGHTIGLFQIEGAGMQDLNKRLQPENFEELIAILALYRPGPMEAGMLDSFINRKHGREKVDYFFPEMEEALKPILEPTYGLIVYQEQVMQIVQAIAGFSLGEADLVRRAMGKKKLEEMVKISAEFVERAVKLGYKSENAKTLFDLIEKFAGYGFNKSHSAAYAAVCYQTAWLKTYYPAVFMANLINLDIDNTDKMVTYVGECRRLGISVSKPDIKECTELFRATSDTSIMFGLNAVKGVGSAAGGLLKTLASCDKDIDLITLFSLTQRDFAKEIEKANKLIIKTEKSVATKYEKLKMEQQKQDLFLTIINPSEAKTAVFNNRLNKIADLLKEILDGETLIETTKALLVQLNKDSENSLDKIGKSVFEALVSVDAFSSFGVSSKSLLENSEFLLDPKKLDQVNFTTDEFTIEEKINLEVSYLGMMVSDVFDPSIRELILTKDIPVESTIAVLVKKEEKRKKDGSIYLNAHFLLADGSSLVASDFNNVSAAHTLGTLCITHLKLNGNYINLMSCKKCTVGMIHKFEDVIDTPAETIVIETVVPEVKPLKQLDIKDRNNAVVIRMFS